MIQLEFTESEKLALAHERYHHPHPSVQRKMEALWLKSQGISHTDICRLTGICSTTLTTYLRSYQESGIDALKTLNFHRPKSELSDHQKTIEEHFRAHPPTGIKEAMATIEALTGVKRSPERVRIFLIKIGMKCRKVGMIPAKADVNAQETFKKTS